MDDLDRLVLAVLESTKYRNVCPDVIRCIGSRELATRQSLKDAIKATKNKLHQIGGAYFDGRVEYARWLGVLRTAAEAEDRTAFLQTCREIMRHHSSTRERLGILDQFYAQTLSALRGVKVVLDIACGFNPLAIPWMPFDENVQYYAYDIYSDLIDFINEFMQIANVRGQAQVCDITHCSPARRADLALILKSVPCIEHLDSSASRRLLETINADHLLVSFPVRSLGGRGKGMVRNYETRFWELVLGKPWSVQRFEFATELAFLISK